MGNINGRVLNIPNVNDFKKHLDTLDEKTVELDAKDADLQAQIDKIEDRTNLVDIVNTYADLQAYYTYDLSADDVIEVLHDETQHDATTYYRWIIALGGKNHWELIGIVGPYVSLHTEETIDAHKTFTAGITLNGKLSPNNNDFGLQLPDTSEFTSDATLIDSVSNQVIHGNKSIADNLEIGADILIRGSLVGESGTEIGVESISTATNLDNGEGNASLIQKNVALSNITWKSLDENIATVDTYGNVTAIAPGETTIKATKIEGLDVYTAECAVKVTRPLKLFSKGVTPTENILYYLDGMITGSGSAYADLNTATQQYGDLNITWKCRGNLTINPWRIGGKNLSAVDRLLYSEDRIEGTVADIIIEHGTKSGDCTVNSLTLIVATDNEFTDELYNETITDISGESSITFTCPRETDKPWTNAYYKLIYNITVNSNSNRFIQLKSITFKEGELLVPVSGVELDIHQATITEGDSIQLTATVLPDDAYDKDVRWSSSNTEVATVSASGLVEGITAGDATITVTTVDGGFTDSCEVTVERQYFHELRLNTNYLDLRVGNSFKLEAYYDVKNIATGESSIALGRGNTLHHNFTFAYGDCLASTNNNQVLLGSYNDQNSTNNLFVIGNGTAEDRKDAFRVASDGNVFVSGKVKTDTPISGSDSAAFLTNKGYVDNKLSFKANDDAVVHLTGNEEISGVKTFRNLIEGHGIVATADTVESNAGFYLYEWAQPTIMSTGRSLDLSGFNTFDDNDATIYWPEHTEEKYDYVLPAKSGTIAIVDSNNSITIGNTILTETQLQKLLALIDTLEAKDIE